MRIAGLRNRQIRQQTAATVRKGSEKKISKQGKEIWGENLDHFRFDWNEDWEQRYVALSDDVINRYCKVHLYLHGKMPSGELLDIMSDKQSLAAPELFALMFSHEPKSLIITSVVWNEAMKKFGGNSMVWSCDGQEINVHWTPEGYSNVPIPCKAPNGVLEACKQAHGCDFSGELFFQIPEFSAIYRRGVNFVLYTKSPNEIAAIGSEIDDSPKNSDFPLFYELYRYPDSFTIPIKGVPSRKKIDMVGLRLFDTPQLQHIALPETTQSALPAPTRQLASGASDEIVITENPSQDDMSGFLTEMADILYPTGFNDLPHFLSTLNHYRNVDNPDDISAIVETLFKNWSIQRENILFRIASGLAELEVAIRVSEIQVFSEHGIGTGNYSPYRIRLPFCDIYFFGLQAFRDAGFADIDFIKTKPLDYAQALSEKSELKPFTIMDNLQANGYEYINADKTAWKVPLSYVEGALYDVDDNAFIPIVLKVHTKKDESQEIQISEVLADLEGAEF